jgi:hypothetical protein
VVKQGETWREMSVNFAEEVSVSYFAKTFNMQLNLTTWGRQLYFLSDLSRATDFHHP